MTHSLECKCFWPPAEAAEKAYCKALTWAVTWPYELYSALESGTVSLGKDRPRAGLSMVIWALHREVSVLIIVPSVIVIEELHGSEHAEVSVVGATGASLDIIRVCVSALEGHFPSRKDVV